MQEKIDTVAEHPGSFIKSILILTLIGLLFLAWGFFIFFTVGNKLPYPWYFGGIEDVPAKSPYSTTSQQVMRNTTSPERNGIIVRQHVRGDGKPETPLPEGGNR